MSPHQGIHIGAVAVHQATATVNYKRNLLDVLLEQTERVRIGRQH